MNIATAQVAVAQAAPPPNVIPLKKEAVSPPSPWILNPFLDLLFCCGGLLWLFVAVRSAIPVDAAGPLGVLMLVSVVGTHMLSETHTAATLVRLQESAETQKHLRSYVKYVTIACALLAIAGFATPAMMPYLAKGYFVWVVQHFLAQSYGITLIYCYKRNYTLNNHERKLLKFLFDATIIYAIARQFTYKLWGADVVFGQPLPYVQLLPEWFCSVLAGVLQFAAVAFVGMVVLKYFREKKLLPLPAALLILTGITMFVVPKSLTNSIWLYVPAFFHGCQYLAVATSFRLKEKGLPDNVSTHKIAGLLLKSDNLKYWGQLFLLGMFIYVAVPHLAEQVGFNFSAAFVTTFCVINFHHFLVDAAIWKMREPKVRKLLIA